MVSAIVSAATGAVRVNAAVTAKKWAAQLANCTAYFAAAADREHVHSVSL